MQHRALGQVTPQTMSAEPGLPSPTMSVSSPSAHATDRPAGASDCAGVAPRRLRYTPGLDGLRAVAVTGVLLYHGGVSWMPGGALGVDLFFVLSGFLITTLLLQELDEHGRIALTDFYVRRIRRLFPALILVLFGVAVYAATTSPSLRAAGLKRDALASLFYVANWHYIWAEQSYFAQFSAPSPLLHVWSLAVEEQWYVFWPPVLAVLWRVLRRNHAALLGVLLTIAAASILWMRHLASGASDPSRAYYGTDTRAHTLLIGAALAVILHRRALTAGLARVLRTTGLLGLVGCIWAFYAFQSDALVLFRGGFAVFAVLAAVTIAGVMAGDGLLSRGLSLRPLVYLGRISYSLYLWHWLIDVWLTPARTGLSLWPLLGVRTAVALAASIVSYTFIEQPLRNSVWERFQRPRLVTVFAAALAAIVAMAVIWPGASRQVTSAAMAAGPQLPPGVEALNVAVFGGSVGWALARPEPIVPTVRIHNGGALGCGLVPGEIMVGERHILEDGTPPCATQHKRWKETLRNTRVDVVVVSYGAWEVFDHWADGKVVPVGSDAYRTMIQDALDDVHALVRAESDVPIVFLDAPCMDESKVTLGSGRDNPRNDPTRVAWVNRVLREWVDRQADDVSIVAWSAWLCPGGKFLREQGDVELRPDGVHLSPAAAVLAWGWLEPQLRALANGTEGAGENPDQVPQTTE